MSAKSTAKQSNRKKTLVATEPKKQPLVSRLAGLRRDFLQRRPHRSFQRTYRRDYKRSLQLPGYIAFSFYVVKTLVARRGVFLRLAALFSLITIVLVGVASQDTVFELTENFESVSQGIFGGGLDQVTEASLLLIAGINGNFTGEVSEAQQLYSGIIFLLIWLTTVWLLRAQLAGKKPQFRDGLYASGAPIVSTALVGLLLLIQLLPAGIAALVYAAAFSSGLLENPFYSVIASVGGVLLIVLSLYLITSTFMALVAVTLPGMYPWKAIRVAGDLVVGRRLRILYRLLWCAFVVLFVGAIILLPLLIAISSLQQAFSILAAIPIIPIVFAIAATIGTLYSSAYVYLLYRKVVDDDASPA